MVDVVLTRVDDFLQCDITKSIVRDIDLVEMW